MKLGKFLCFQLVLFVFLPGATYKYFGASSMALGVVLSFVSFLAYPVFCGSSGIVDKVRFSGYNLVVFFGLLFSTVFLGFIVYLTNQESFVFSRFLSSLLILTLFFVFSYLFYSFISSIDTKLLDKCVSLIFIIFLLDGFIASSKFFLFGGSKSLIFFTEPSHYALSLAPFFLYKVITSYHSRFNLILIFLSVAVISFFLKSLVLITLLALSVIIVLRKRESLIVISVFLILVSLFSEELTYFSERLNLTFESDNLSVLVYLSGIERAIISIVDTSGLGLGFQQMGYYGNDGILMDRILKLVGHRVNYNDGGTLGAKMAAEFGIFSLILLLVYLITFLKTIIFLKESIIYGRGKKQIFSSTEVLMIALYLSFFLSLFVRGVGYFSGGTFLFYVSLWYIFGSRYRFMDVTKI
nr:putative O-antigen polymerase [Vibrio metoecus]